MRTMKRGQIWIKAGEAGVEIEPSWSTAQIADALDAAFAARGSDYRTARTASGHAHLRSLLRAMRTMPIIWPATGEIISQAESQRRFSRHMDAVYRAHGITFGKPRGPPLTAAGRERPA